MNCAIILAGGIGERMGTQIPKQFIKVNNKPIIVYAMENFEKHPLIDLIEVVCLRVHLATSYQSPFYEVGIVPSKLL